MPKRKAQNGAVEQPWYMKRSSDIQNLTPITPIKEELTKGLPKRKIPQEAQKIKDAKADAARLRKLNSIKREAAIKKEREGRIQDSEESEQNPFKKDFWTKENFAKSAAADKLRFSNSPNIFDDYLNPFSYVGSIGDNLAKAQTLPEYATAIAEPLLVGGLAGIGTKTTGQFVNNLTNPVAGVNDLFKKQNNRITRGFVDWGNAVDYTKNPEFVPRLYENSIKQPYVPPTTDPALMATLKEYKQGGVIKDDMGYWNPANHGHPVEINSNYITMKPSPYTGAEVPTDLIGVSDTGDVKYMERGKDYKFKGSKVTEFPIAQDGKTIQDGGQLKKLDQLTNFTNYNDMIKAQDGVQVSPRKVDTIPAGYKPFGKDAQGRDLFIFEQQQAKPVKPSVKKVVTNTSTSVRKPIKPKQKVAQEATKDIVYMEFPVQQTSTEPVKTVWPEVFMSPGGYGAQAAGRFRYMTRDTPDWKKYAGDTSTFDKAVDFVFTDRDGNPVPSRGRYIVPSTEWDKMTKGTYGAYNFDEKSLSPYKVEYKNGGMIKRADGSYSKRGLWDNIRANKGSGKKPTKEMLAQERKINSKKEYGGQIEPFYYAQDGADIKPITERIETRRMPVQAPIAVNSPAQRTTLSNYQDANDAQKQAVTKANKMSNGVEQEGEENQNGFNFVTPAMALIDRLMPYQPINNNISVDQYESYNPYPMGTGSQALFEQGGVVGNRYISGTGIRFRHGGEIMNVASPQNPIARMGGHFSSYEQGGELSLYDDTTGAQPISNNLYSGEIVEFKGPSHDERNNVGSKGIPANINGQDIEVESPETGYMNVNGDFNIFSASHKSSTGKSFSNESKRIAKDERKTMSRLNKAMTLINEANPDDPFEQLKFKSGMLKKEGAEMKMKKLTQEKEMLAQEQENKLAFAEALGIKPKDLDKAKYGKMLKAQGGISGRNLPATSGVRREEEQPINGRVLPPNYTIDATQFQPLNPSLIQETDQFIDSSFQQKYPTTATTSKKSALQEAIDAGIIEAPKTNNYYNAMPSIGGNKSESDVEGFDYSQILPELLAIGSNAPQPVPSFMPERPDMMQAYNISVQDQLANNERSFRAMQQIAGNNPQALSTLAAQKYAADQDAVFKNQMVNQQMQADVTNQNRQLQAGYNAQRAQAAEQQFLRQAGARAKTKEIDQAAIQSIITKIATDKASDREYKIIENLYGFRFDKNGKPTYKGKPVDWKIFERAAESITSAPKTEETPKKSKYGMSIQRQFKKYS
jgi:hypothetical protein